MENVSCKRNREPIFTSRPNWIAPPQKRDSWRLSQICHEGNGKEKGEKRAKRGRERERKGKERKIDREAKRGNGGEQWSIATRHEFDWNSNWWRDEQVGPGHGAWRTENGLEVRR